MARGAGAAPSKERRRRRAGPASGGPLGLCARSRGDEGARRCVCSLRSPSTFFLGEAEAATALDVAEMVGAMKFFTPLARALGVLAPFSCCSFSFSPKDLRGDARHPQTPPLLDTDELLCGQSAGLKGLEPALLRMAQHELAGPGAAVAISPERNRRPGNLTLLLISLPEISPVFCPWSMRSSGGLMS